MGATYTTREALKNALDFAESARNNSRLDRALATGTEAVDSLCKRTFIPWTGTRYFEWPNDQRAFPWRLWLDQDEVISVSALVSGGVVIPSGSYFLEPVNVGPPFTSVEVSLASQSSFSVGATYQRSIAMTGTFGYKLNDQPAGSLAEALDTTETGVDVSDSSAIGVGDLILVDTERMVVTNKTMLTTGQTLQTPVGSSVAEVLLAVTDGTKYTVGETVLLDAERMLITDIAGNNLIVKRAWDGTVLASHTGSTIYAPRTLTVARGAQGTIAATHSNAAPILRHNPPELVQELCLAEAVNFYLQGASGYARGVGNTDAKRAIAGLLDGMNDLRDRCYAAHGRKTRQGAV